VNREQLRGHLVANRIAGEVATTRENNLTNFARMSRRDPSYLFGLRPAGSWTPADVLRLMVERVGVHPDPRYAAGVDTIDPDKTLDRLDAMAARLRGAAQRRERVLVATGHPAGVFAIHAELARALAGAGCTLLTPGAGWSFLNQAGHRREIRHLAGVAVVSDRGELNHTHSPRPMEAMLAELAHRGEAPPDLVVADHGYAGAAGQAGVATVGFADCNDPALFVGEAEGRIEVAVPLDDNVLPHRYAPITGYLLSQFPVPQQSQPSP